ncbi:MAG: division plane positioning ATPase MipZ [Rhizobiaceae bacterium]|nr:division plane positioning ATPase MipZ [Rhizobiaceae bacterium]
MFSDTAEHQQAYVIVCGNEKGGTGKTTTSMHIAIALLNAGYRVATIDLDGRQKTLTRYIENRKNWSDRYNLNLLIPTHDYVEPSTAETKSDRNSEELSNFMAIISRTEQNHDFVVVDTAGHDGYLMQLSHSIADTLISPINDSYLDFDILGQVDALTGDVIKLSHYAKTVREARRKRRIADNGFLDWVIVRNRLSTLHSRNSSSLISSLKSLSMRLGCRIADGISERVVFRELFPIGLTVLDDLEEATFGGQISNSHIAARHEVRSLIAALRLPIDELGRKRAEARRNWLKNADKPIDMMGLLAD